jgi:hypothetical protein
MLETRHNFTIKKSSFSNTVVKGYTTTLKEVGRIVRTTTREANQIKYHKLNISYLYLIN